MSWIQIDGGGHVRTGKLGVRPNDKPVGHAFGETTATRIQCTVSGAVQRREYLCVEHDVHGPVLGQVREVSRKSDLSLEKAMMLDRGEEVDVGEHNFATVEILGYVDNRGLLQVPRTPFPVGAPIQRPDQRLIRAVLGLKDDPAHGAYLGLLAGHDVPVFLDINTMVQKHVSVLAKTGGGKSYATGVLVEELLKHGVTALIIDPHAEYSSLGEPNDSQVDFQRFSVGPKGYGDRLLEFSPDPRTNPRAKPLRFTLRNLEAREILDLTGQRRNRAHLTALKRTIDALKKTGKDYDLEDVIRVLQADEDPVKGTLVGELEYLNDIEMFAKEGTSINELVVEGRATIINLKGTPPEVQELIVNRIATALFQLRKAGKVPPMMLVVEEAHNFCPQVGLAASSRILRTIASEGRKFGLGLLIVTQRAAKVDKNVLSQCNLQVVLKVTNPNDLKAIAASVEGMTAGMEEEIQRLPVGVALVMGANLATPLFVEVRPRETRHGGESVKVLPD